MGAFYSSIQVRSENRDAVKSAVETVARDSTTKYLIGSLLGGWVAVYPNDVGKGESCASALSKELKTTALFLMVHDSDIFAYSFLHDGELLNEYSSDPDAFEEVSASEHERLAAKPELFQEFVDSPQKFDELDRLLKRGEAAAKYDFAEQRLEKFAKLLGIRNTLTSYEYLTQGEHDGIKGWKEFIHVPDQSAEKAAKKAAEAALRVEKQRLQKEGLLCAENLPPGNKKQRINARGEFCPDPKGGGFLVLWHSLAGMPKPPELIRLQPPWTPIREEMVASLFAPSNPTMSATGKWFALFDRELKLWDWQQREVIGEVKNDGAPIEFSKDEKLLFCRGRKRFDVISLATWQLVQTIETGSENTGVQAFHPSDKYLVTRERQDRLGIINVESGKLENVLLSGEVRNWAGYGRLFIDTFKQAGVNLDAEKWKDEFVRGSDNIMNLRFSADGRLLLCALTCGLRVFEWEKLLTAVQTTPEPAFTIVPVPEAVGVQHLQFVNFVYDVIQDVAQNRLLFGGIEGTIRYLNLQDGSTGILLDPPGKSPISRLELSPNRKFIGCLIGPSFQEEDEKPWRIQIWNYSALCKVRGLL